MLAPHTAPLYRERRACRPYHFRGRSLDSQLRRDL